MEKKAPHQHYTQKNNWAQDKKPLDSNNKVGYATAIVLGSLYGGMILINVIKGFLN